jgi:hypothetical protein
MSCPAALANGNTAVNRKTARTPHQPPSRTRGKLTRAARLRLAADPVAAHERSASLSPARCGHPTFSLVASSAREGVRLEQREASAGLRVAQYKIRPNRQRRRRQGLAADPWRQVGDDNSILRSRSGLFWVRESSRISPLHVNSQSTPCGDSSSSYYPRF